MFLSIFRLNYCRWSFEIDDRASYKTSNNIIESWSLDGLVVLRSVLRSCFWQFNPQILLQNSKGLGLHRSIFCRHFHWYFRLYGVVPWDWSSCLISTVFNKHYFSIFHFVFSPIILTKLSTKCFCFLKSSHEKYSPAYYANVKRIGSWSTAVASDLSKFLFTIQKQIPL